MATKISTTASTNQPSAQQQQQPRRNTEPNTNHQPQSSDTISLASTTIPEYPEDGERTPRAPSFTSTLVPEDQPYRGFRSEAAYLAALNEWAESKKYIQPGDGLVGYYGTTTMEEYASRPKVEFDIAKRWRERKAKREARRASAAV